MKSPEQISEALVRQWQRPAKRQELFNNAASWPISLNIGKPSPKQISQNVTEVRSHVQKWRAIRIGNVCFEPIKYRSTSEPISVPTKWRFEGIQEWINACNNRSVKGEYERLQLALAKAHPSFHSVLIRYFSKWLHLPEADLFASLDLAMRLEPGMAKGLPLRMISGEGLDTKFYERNEQFLVTLLDQRFNSEVGKVGLRTFLEAAADDEHWVLVADKDGKLLPFQSLRLKTSELGKSSLPGENLFIIENERCLHQLPEVIPNTIVVLGCGLDLAWTAAEWLSAKNIFYWGDIDTWGLKCLAQVRQNHPDVKALMTTEKIFDEYVKHSVKEPNPSDSIAPSGLTISEQKLYERLLTEERGRLEQEFIPLEIVHRMVMNAIKLGQ